MRSLLARWTLAILVVTALGTTSIEAADKWLSVRSKNFLLVGNASESQLRRIGRNLEEFRTAFVTLFPWTGKEATVGTTVIVFKNDDSFRPFKPLYEGKTVNVAGYFQAGPDVNFIALTGELNSSRTIYHEFVHSLLKDSASQLPVWVGEGLAEFYSVSEIGANGTEVLLGRPIAQHLDT